jgi:hypothetical protein
MNIETEDRIAPSVATTTPRRAAAKMATQFFKKQPLFLWRAEGPGHCEAPMRLSAPLRLDEACGYMTAKFKPLDGPPHLPMAVMRTGRPSCQREIATHGFPVVGEPFPFWGPCRPHGYPPTFAIAPTCSGRPAAAEIFEGITYGCKQLEPSEEASEVVHWVRINLTAPQIRWLEGASKPWQASHQSRGRAVNRPHGPGEP